MKKRNLKLDELKVNSFTTSEEESLKAGRAPLSEIETIPTFNAEGCHSAIELNCQFTQNNQVGCV